ncbi:MAG TPA: tetraacyldisaccharide 4'-kinase [Anaerolineae bacterium]|nr:tetraacyldisaccharide 4'-kinase [Anaerolineae bacterium]
MRKLIEDILYEKRFDSYLTPLRTGLGILEGGYHVITDIRNFLYDKHIFKIHDVRCKVVSIGNVTLGGTGKTPAVIMTARMVQKAGYSVAVVSHGYKGGSRTPLVVSDGTDMCISPVESGDEPHIIAWSLPGIPVVTGKDRYRAALLANERFKPHVIILDDGLQHRRLYRTVDVVTIDAENPFGNEHLLPRGILRESPYVLKRVQAVIITRFREEFKRDKIKRFMEFYGCKAPIFWSIHVPVGFRRPGSVTRLELETVSGRKVAVLSNIARPDSFHHMLESLGVDIITKHIMADHHRYKEEELKKIEMNARDAGADLLVMTAKDERNIPEHYNVELVEKLILDIEAVLLGDEEKYLEIVCPYGKKN